MAGHVALLQEMRNRPRLKIWSGDPQEGDCLADLHLTRHKSRCSAYLVYICNILHVVNSWSYSALLLTITSKFISDFTHILTDYPAAQNMGLLKKIIVAQLVRNFQASYGAPKFIAVFTRACMSFLPSAR